MNKQPEKMTARYYRVAHMNDTNLYLDNQMHQFTESKLLSALCALGKGGEQK